LIPLGLLAVIANCGSHSEQIFRKAWGKDFEKKKNEIIEAREKWKQNNIRSYSFVVAKYVGGQSSPWNHSPVLIKVADCRDLSVEMVDKIDISLLAGTGGFEEFDTIEKLFDYMLRHLEMGEIVEGDYDENLGYPNSVRLSTSFEIHGKRSIAISKFARAN